jgi:hypothetical protein
MKGDRSDEDCWRIGTELARDMLVGDYLDQMAIEDDCREGRPQTNVVWWYLRRLRELDDDRVDAAFGAVLSDFVGSYSGSWYSDEDLNRMTAKPIATECSRELPEAEPLSNVVPFRARGGAA